MIEIIEVPDGLRSIVSCDVCHERIESAALAVAVRFTAGGVWHLHKGRCHTDAERMVPVFRRGFMELAEHLRQLDHNAGTQVEQ